MSGSNNSSTGGYILDVAPEPPSADAVQAALQQMTATLCGLPGNLVRPRWQPMPPSQPDAQTTWAAIGVTMIEADEYPAFVHVGSAALTGLPPGYSIMQRHETMTVLVSFYGPLAEDAAALLRDGLYVGQNFEPLMSLGIKLRTVADLARAPELVNQQYINRIDLRLEFRQQIERIYPILNLDGADVTITTDDGATASVSVRGTA